MDEAKFITLDNCLTILIYTDRSKSTNHMELFTFYGGNYSSYIDYNGKKRNIKEGSAHLLEHYVCENTVSGDLLDNLRKYNVLSCNAGTSAFNTSYFFNTVCNFYECLDTFLDGIYNVSFTNEKLNKTKYAVLNEIRDSQNNEGRRIADIRDRTLFSNCMDNLGSEDSINSITVNDLKDIYDSIYVPCNQFLVVASNFDYDIVLDKIRMFYNNMSFKCNKKLPKIIDKRDIVSKYTTYECNLMDEVTVSFKIDIRDLSNYDGYKLDWYIGWFLDINFSRYSKINEYINNSDDYIGSIGNSFYYYNGYLVIEIYALTSLCDDFENIVISTANGISDDDRELFELVKKNSLTSLSVRKDSISNYVRPIEDNYITFDYAEVDDIDVIKNFSYDDYKKVINSIDFSYYSVFYRKKK